MQMPSTIVAALGTLQLAASSCCHRGCHPLLRMQLAQLAQGPGAARLPCAGGARPGERGAVRGAGEYSWY